jgi:uncharacterized protein (TIGR03067 family)
MSPLLLGVALTVGAPALKERPPKAPPLVGRWAATELVINGRADPQAQGLEYEFTAEGGWAIYRDGQPLDGARRYTVDPRTKPAAIDLTENAATYLGISKVEGDTLVVLFPVNANGDRPAGFDAPGAGLMKVVMTRVKAGN